MSKFDPKRLIPRSLTGQVMLALAGALLLAQTIGAILLYKAQAGYREQQVTQELAMRTAIALRHRDDVDPSDGPLPPPPPPMPGEGERQKHHRDNPPMMIGRPGPDDMPRGPRPVRVKDFQPNPGDEAKPEISQRLNELLGSQDLKPLRLMVVERDLVDDPFWQKRVNKRYAMMGDHAPPKPKHLLVAAAQIQPGGEWMVVRSSIPARDPWLLVTLIAQTLFIYAVLVGAIALILRRIARPLAALTSRVDQFARTRESTNQIEPEGPADVRHLIEAHNAMEQRITTLINEKDVMLGAIGHDLKTPLAALRVRIESVEDDAERDKMAKTIEDITRSLDDILSLARVGRPSDPVEPTELAALVASIVEEYEDMGDDVEFDHAPRLVMPARATWLRRALRNLIGNALRYAGSAQVTMMREEAEGKPWAVIRVVDSGRGIGGDIEKMFEPFTRGEPSRNTATGGAGLGLTLARAIADQHGGRLTLNNRTDEKGVVVGLMATLWLPLPA